MIKGAGVDTSNFVNIEGAVVVNNNGFKVQEAKTMNGLLTFALTTASVDAAIPEPTDLVALPKSVGYRVLAAAGLIVAAIEYQPSTIMSFAKTKHGKEGEVSGAEHTSGASASKANKHEKGQTRKQQVNRDKKGKILTGTAINNFFEFKL